MMFELWHMGSGNLVGSYDSEEAAVAALQRFASKYPPKELDDLVLQSVDRYGLTHVVGAGRADLMRLLASGGTASSR